MLLLDHYVGMLLVNRVFCHQLLLNLVIILNRMNACQASWLVTWITKSSYPQGSALLLCCFIVLNLLCHWKMGEEINNCLLIQATTTNNIFADLFKSGVRR